MFSNAKRFNYNEIYPRSTLESCEVYAKRCSSFSSRSSSNKPTTNMKNGVAFLTSTRKSRRDYFQIAKSEMEHQGPICERFLRRHSLIQTPPIKENRNSKGSSSFERTSTFSPRPSRILTRSLSATPEKCESSCCRRSRSTTNTNPLKISMKKEVQVKNESNPRSKSCDLSGKSKKIRASLSKIPVLISQSPSTSSLHKSNRDEIRSLTPDNELGDDELIFHTLPSESFGAYSNFRKFNQNESSSEESMLDVFDKKMLNFRRRIQEIQLTSSDEGINSPLISSHDDFDRIIQHFDNKISSLLSERSEKSSPTSDTEKPESTTKSRPSESHFNRKLEKDQPLEVNLRVVLEHDVKNGCNKNEEAEPKKENKEAVYLQVMDQLCKKLAETEAENRKLKAEKTATFKKFYRFLRRSKK